MTPTDLLEFESCWPIDSPAKREAIRRHLGITEVRYTVLLARAADSVEGIAANPVTARMVRESAARKAAERLSRVA